MKVEDQGINLFTFSLFCIQSSMSFRQKECDDFWDCCAERHTKVEGKSGVVNCRDLTPSICKDLLVMRLRTSPQTFVYLAQTSTSLSRYMELQVIFRKKIRLIG